jgi:hypothetical protein
MPDTRSWGFNPRAYLHLVTRLVVDRWPNAKLYGCCQPDGAFRGPLLALSQGSPAPRALSRAKP